MGMGRRRGRKAPNEERDDQSAQSLPVSWRRLFAYLWPYRWRMALALTALFVSSVLSLVFPWVIQNVIDSVLVNGDVQMLDQITFTLLGVFLLRSVTTLIDNYNTNVVGESIVRNLRVELYAHLQSLSLGFFAKRRVGELVSRLSSDVTVVRTTLTNSAGVVLEQSLILIGSVVVMLILNWRLTLFIVVLAPAIAVLGGLFGMFLRRTSMQVQDEIAQSTVVLEESLQGIRVVKSFTREAYEVKRFTDAINRAFAVTMKVLRVRSLFGPMIAFLGFASLALILWFGGREVLDGRLTGGSLIAFLFYGATLATSLVSLSGLYTQIQETLGASRRIFELLDMVPDVKDLPDAKSLTQSIGPVQGRITFEDVYFSYEDRQEVLHGINLDIAPGEILALVGPSGAGKSTIFNLIPRFYDPTNGVLKLDGVDMKTLTQVSLREQIAIVPQETLLFGGTILENIQYGKLDATPEEIIDAAKTANAHEFIESLPDKYQTVVGERGVRLSGGQRQRIAIARAVLKNSRILLLDEATSSLDSESESAVQDALGKLMRGRTTVIIAHRLSTIQVATRIAVLDQGQIIELGNHDELMALDGLYAKYYAMQFRADMLALQPGK